VILWCFCREARQLERAACWLTVARLRWRFEEFQGLSGVDSYHNIGVRTNSAASPDMPEGEISIQV
jgi:hypothetical protein